jgi:hypothetical protein
MSWVDILSFLKKKIQRIQNIQKIPASLNAMIKQIAERLQNLFSLFITNHGKRNTFYAL